ncbi:DMT family transporter [Hyperthermus butylicus]|uniref:Membrane protein n=1 Tax=Hyperthermus butylicus (strain DSM 5456 / JCM 9403 / PLM1-5) TaxID=415426 RepID=A2BJJ7_HYPBU|nr:EamA family transporter [Hyperthermus butylicus]ABM80158.1 putative membrane protein [Hyperthermus butylicus DSM 5456]
MTRTRGLAYAVTAAILWGSIGVAYRLALSHGASREWLILGRPLIGGLGSLAATVLGYGRPGRWSLLVGAGTLAPLVVVYLFAVELLGAALASILLYTAPIWVALLGLLLLGEKPGTRGALAVALGFTGSFLIAFEGWARASLVAVLVGLAAGLLYAAYMLAARYALRHGAGELEVGLHSQPFTAMAVAAVTKPGELPATVDLPWMLYLGVATMLVPYVLHARALRLLEAYRVSVVSLIEPLAATVLAALLLGEKLTALQLVGATLILAASLLALEKGR